jgi:hypothetical protein
VAADQFCPLADPPLALPLWLRRPSKISSGRARIIAYGEGRLTAGTATDLIGAAALLRSGASQSMMTTVLAGVCGDCPRAKEEGEGGDDAGGVSMVRAVVGT